MECHPVYWENWENIMTFLSAELAQRVVKVLHRGLSMRGKNFSRQHFETFFLFFQENGL